MKQFTMEVLAYTEFGAVHETLRYYPYYKIEPNNEWIKINCTKNE